MAFENASHIDELVASSPTTTDDPFGANAIYLELQQLKTVLTTDFANVSGAVTASDVELDYVNIATLGTAETSKALTISATDTWNVAGMTCANLGTITTVDINGGSIDAAAIGAASASTGAFTTLSASGAVTLSTTLTVTGAVALNGTLALASGTTANEISIDGTLAGDSDDAIPTEKAVKTYVDSQTVSDHITLNAIIADVGTGETVWVPIPATGTITRVDTVLEGAITGADATVTVKTAADATIAAVTITQSGSAAGDVDSNASPTNTAVTAGTAIKVVSDAASTGPQRLWVSIIMSVTP